MGLLDRFLKRGKSRSGTNVITHSDFGLYIEVYRNFHIDRNTQVICAFGSQS